MDSVTNALAGAAIGRAGFQDKLGPRCATLTGILAAQAADLDIVFRLFSSNEVFAHRGVSHSLLGILIGSCVVVALVRLFARAAPLKPLALLVLLGYASHVLLDVMTSGGVALLSPFNTERMALSWLYIIDLVLILILVAPWFLRKVMPEIKAFRAMLVVSGLYMAMCGFAHGVAEASLELSLERHQVDAHVRYVMPAPFAPMRWNAVAMDADKYYQMNLNLPAVPESFYRSERHHLGHPAVDALRRSAVGRKLFNKFRAPVATIEKLGAGHVRVVMDDLRFNHWLTQRWGVLYFRFVIEMKKDDAGRWKKEGAGSFRTDYLED